MHFFNFDHLRIKLQSSNLFWSTKFCAPSLPLPPFIFSYLQALIHGFLWWWASSRLIFSLKWRLQSSFSFSISLPSNFKEQMTPLMKKIQGLQAPHEVTSHSHKHLTNECGRMQKITFGSIGKCHFKRCKCLIKHARMCLLSHQHWSRFKPTHIYL